ncbi:MAG: glycosyltransferase family 39 protein [Solirubrobacteraceae bacterium]
MSAASQSPAWRLRLTPEQGPVSRSQPVDRVTVAVVLTVATVVAAALRLPFLGHQSLWFDETYTRNILAASNLVRLWHDIKATESTPPLYYFIAWLGGGRSAVAMRLIPALALTAAVPVAYLAVRKLIGQRGALATAAILAVNPMLVAFSTDARSYGLLVLTSLLSVWATSELLAGGGRRWFAIWALTSIAAMWTHYFAAFVIGGEVLALAIWLPGSRRELAAWTTAIVVLVLPLVPLVLHQTGDQRAAFIAGLSLSSRLTQAVRQFAMGANVPRTWLEALGLVLFVGATAIGVVLAALGGRGPRTVLLIAAIAFGVPLVMAVTHIDDLFYVRNVVAALPLVAALAAPVLLRLRWFPLALYLILATLTSVWVATNWRYEQLDWRSAIAPAEAADRGAPVLALGSFQEPVVATYLCRTPMSSVQTDESWLLVPPARAPGHRALFPSPAPALPGFTPVHVQERHGFQIILERAAKPTTLSSASVPGAWLFAGSPAGKRCSVS